MKEFEIPFWALSLSYWLHLLSTVVWLGGLVLMTLIAWPAVRGQILSADQWIALRQRFTPWSNISLAVLWITGFLQMTSDSNYEGFLVIHSVWAQAILIKHLAVIAMMGFGLYIQWRVHPSLERLNLLSGKKPELAQAEKESLLRQETRLLRLSLICAAAVLFFTAIATAV
ncbi:MAG: CopD family protein [Candidatus Promineifilaceae bacterium]